MDRDRLNRDRLKDVQQSDLTESKVNEDFIDWLKNAGPMWLTVILLGVCVFLFVQNYRRGQEANRQAAWDAFFQVQNSHPDTIESTANEDDFQGVFAVPQLLKIRAADIYLQQVQAGRLHPEDIPADAEGTDATVLTEDMREQYLSHAERLYEEVLNAEEDRGVGFTVHVFHALSGKAAVAESRGEFDRARDYYEQAANRAEPGFSHLAAQAQTRIESLDQFTDDVTLPTLAQLPKDFTPSNPVSAEYDPALVKWLRPPLNLPTRPAEDS